MITGKRAETWSVQEWYKKKTSLEFDANRHVSKKTERLNESPPFVDVTDNNIDVRDTFDTIDGVESFWVESSGRIA